MRFQALAADYDGTLAADGALPNEVLQSLRRFHSSGRRLIMVTGRRLEDLQSVCPHLDPFDFIVAENGGILYRPSTGERKVLAPAPPRELVPLLRRRGVRHIEEGATLVATVKPYETAAMEAIRDLGLELKLVFNKDAVMILAPGVSKASGLKSALVELELSAHNVVAIGDAENDHAFVDVCECGVAVANALPMLKKHTNFVTRSEAGRGVMELIDEILTDDLRSREANLKRHHLLLGKRVDDGAEQRFAPYGTVALIAGTSGGGKTSSTLRLLERLADAGYQFCGFDPEGDYETFEDAVILGSPHHAPAADEVLQLLRNPKQNVIVNLLGVPLAERPQFCASLMVRVQELRAQTGRPHWLMFDEAHHLFPAEWGSAQICLPDQLETALLITVHPDQASPAVLKHVNLMMGVGDDPASTLKELAQVLGKPAPGGLPPKLEKRQAAVWLPASSEPPVVVAMERGRTEHFRHVRKYAEGELVPERSFYFHGPEGKLNLRAHNLIMFLELANGVDDETWLHHLRQGHYSHWFADVVGDDELGKESRAIEGDRSLSPRDSRARIRAAVERRYTLPENPALPKIGAPK